MRIRRARDNVLELFRRVCSRVREVNELFSRESTSLNLSYEVELFKGLFTPFAAGASQNYEFYLEYENGAKLQLLYVRITAVIVLATEIKLTLFTRQ